MASPEISVMPGNKDTKLDVSSSSSSSCDEQYEFVESSHPQQVLTGLHSLREANQYCDVTICCDAAEVRCHKIVLASFSPYFQAMFSVDLKESQQDRITIKGVEAAMIQALVDYAYTATVRITRDNVQALLSAANLLRVLPVRDACCRFMEKHMDEANCIGIHCFAEAHACTELQQSAKNFVLRYFPEVYQQDEFLHITHSKLIEFIASDDLTVESEEVVLSAVMKWLDADSEAHSPDFAKVLEHVRLPLLSPYYVHDCVEKYPIIQESPDCQKLVEEAKMYHLLLDRRAEMQTQRTRPRKASGMLEVIIAVGGEDDKVVLRSVESFDPHANQWKTLACLPFAVSKHGLVVNGSNHMYMAGGEFPDGSASRSMWRYDPCFDTWQEMASMNTPRSELGVALLDGSVYAVGGWEGSARLDSVERYNPATNQWTFVAPLKLEVTSPAVVAHDGKLYVTGGAILEDGDGIDLVQCFEPRTNTWTELAPMLIARSGSAACVLNSRIYVIGGWHASTENTAKVERYDPARDVWEVRASMHERRYRPGVAVVDGKIYVCGGEEGWDRYHDTIECYDEAGDAWTITGEMPTSRSWLSCVAMTLRRDVACRGDKHSAAAAATAATCIV